jgi:hypothetical protein
MSRAEREHVLSALHQQGVSAWPAIDVPLERFSAHLALVNPTEPTVEALAKLSGEGLMLCVGCLEGQPAALGIFESLYLAPLARVLGKLEGGSEVANDVLQRLRGQFLAPASGHSSFLSYSGAGALGV